MKQWNANIGAVHTASASHKEVEEWRKCQPGHAFGGLISSSAAAVIAESSRAIKVEVRAVFILTNDRLRSIGRSTEKIGVPNDE
ncbi:MULTISPECIES: hypothetical protein [unclassified Bradyrhizobium]